MANFLNKLMQRIKPTAEEPASEDGSTLPPLYDKYEASGRRAFGLAPIAVALAALGAIGGAGYGLWLNPPLKLVGQGEMALRINQLTGSVSMVKEGSAIALPGIHQLRRYSLGDQVYRPNTKGGTEGVLGVQSVEGLTLGIELSVRYAIEPARAGELPSNRPAQWSADLVDPAVQDAVFKILPSYTVREVFSTKRAEILAAVEAQLKEHLARSGLILRSVSIGAIGLPAEYKQGMERLLAEELASEKMRFTLELKEKNVKAAAFEAEAEKVRKELEAQSLAKSQVIEAESRASAQLIDARAQEQAMAHILPFKQRQIEQRKLEAEAEKVARVKAAEGNAAARIIEAEGEATSRQKLADAEVYRQDHLGKLNSEQMQRDGALVTQYPLLIQKIMAEKLSDKINVIVAAPPSNGGFIGNNLLGAGQNAQAFSQATLIPSDGQADASEADHSVEE